jgi:hypothetical protein
VVTDTLEEAACQKAAGVAGVGGIPQPLEEPAPPIRARAGYRALAVVGQKARRGGRTDVNEGLSRELFAVIPVNR